jgi:hypothetical protein
MMDADFIDANGNALILCDWKCRSLCAAACFRGRDLSYEHRMVSYSCATLRLLQCVEPFE